MQGPIMQGLGGAPASCRETIHKLGDAHPMSVAKLTRLGHKVLVVRGAG